MAWAIGVCIFATGMLGIAAQGLLLRELLVCFSGNELSIGVSLGLWLLLEAGGSWLAGRSRRRQPVARAFIILTSALCLTFPAAVLVARLARPWFGLAPGQVPSLPVMLAIAFITLLPVSLLHGAQFTLGVELMHHSCSSPPQAVRRTYIVETLGSIVGGLLLALVLVDRAGSLRIALILGGLNLLALVGLELNSISTSFQPKPACAWGLGSSLLLLGFGLAIGTGNDNRLERATIQRQYPGQSIVWFGNSHYSEIVVLRREEQYTVLCDGIPTIVVPTPDQALVEEFAHIPMLLHGRAQRVLLIGGGLDGMLGELAKYPDAVIDYCEPDPMLIDVVRRFMADQTRSAFAGGRIRFARIDGRSFLRQSPAGVYDIILIGSGLPTTLQLNRLFTREFFLLARSRLAADGVLAMTTPGSTAYLGDDLARMNAIRNLTLHSVFRQVEVLPGDFNIILAHNRDRGLNRPPPEELERRLRDLNIDAPFLTAGEFARRGSPDAVTDYWQQVSSCRAPVEINADAHPTEVMAALSYRLAATDPRAAGWFRPAGGWRRFLPLAPLLLLVAALALRRRRRRFVLGWAALSTGLSGATVSLLLLLAFQVTAGTVYLNLILLTTAFMAGTAIGGFFSGPLLMLDAANGVVLILPLAVMRIPSPGFSYTAVMVAAIVAGLLLGMEFIAVNRAFFVPSADAQRQAQPGRTAGGLYAADLLGGFLGSMLVPIFLVPALGMTATAVAILAIKLLSVLALRYTAPSG